MDEITDFFTNYLPNKLQNNPDLITSVNAVYQFDIDGFGNWMVDLTTDGGVVAAGRHDSPGCVVTTSSDNFEKLLNNPSAGMTLFMTGKLKVSDIGLGMKLQGLLS